MKERQLNNQSDVKIMNLAKQASHKLSQVQTRLIEGYPVTDVNSLLLDALEASIQALREVDKASVQCATVPLLEGVEEGQQFPQKKEPKEGPVATTYYSFVELCLGGAESYLNMEPYVQAWARMRGPRPKLHEFLGFSYADWVSIMKSPTSGKYEVLLDVLKGLGYKHLHNGQK